MECLLIILSSFGKRQLNILSKATYLAKYTLIYAFLNIKAMTLVLVVPCYNTD